MDKAPSTSSAGRPHAQYCPPADARRPLPATSCGGAVSAHYILLIDEEQGGRDDNPRLSAFDRPLPFCGCGIGWCSCLLGFLFPFLWYYAAILFCCDYYRKDPRERAGLAAAATAALLFTVAAALSATIALLILYRPPPPA